MTGLKAIRWSLLIPPLIVIFAAIPRLSEGIALERAFPESALVGANVTLPSASYLMLEKLLARAPAADGEAQILRAEAALGAGRPPQTLISSVKSGLAHAPADARGWILLASLLSDRDPQQAAKALAQAYMLAPWDYYLIAPRAAVGAGLWTYLPDKTRGKLLDDADLIATDTDRRDDLHALLRRPGGSLLVTRALQADPDAIRKLNRSLARETLHLQ